MYKSTVKAKVNSREIYGEVSEWFKELVLKTSDLARDRGFESHPLRQNIRYGGDEINTIL